MARISLAETYTYLGWHNKRQWQRADPSGSWSFGKSLPQEQAGDLHTDKYGQLQGVHKDRAESPEGKPWNKYASKDLIVPFHIYIKD